ncbi:hypothetical protein BD311DRAFT_612376, partial [Dichomitus squalens]
VYTKELYRHGWGLPLWFPQAGAHEPLIGDVGCLIEGRFETFFNSTRHPNDTVHQPKGVPAEFEPLYSDPSHVSPLAGELTSYVVSSANSKRRADPNNALSKTDLDFTFAGDTGALLVLPADVHREAIMAHGRIIRYIIKHSSSWCTFAHSLDYEFAEEDIVFVSGTTKARTFGMAVFQDS